HVLRQLETGRGIELDLRCARRGCGSRGGGGRPRHRKTTLKRSTPINRQNTASGGISRDVTTISTTCGSAFVAGFNRSAHRRAVNTSHRAADRAASSVAPTTKAATVTVSAATIM